MKSSELARKGKKTLETERRAAERAERQEKREAYARRQAERYGRLAEYSIAPENRRQYEARAGEWEKISAQTPPQRLACEEESGIIGLSEGKEGTPVTDWTILGKLDQTLLEDTFGKLHSDEIIITGERLEHIRLHHPQDVELFLQYGIDAIQAPDVILQDSKHECFCAEEMPETHLNLVVRLSIEQDFDPKHPMNSVMTCYRIRERNVKKLISRCRMLYTRNKCYIITVR